MSKIKFAAKQEYEFIENFKLLQASFKKKSVDKACALHSNAPHITPPCRMCLWIAW